MDTLSFNSELFEIWDCGTRIYIAKDDNVIGVPITAVKRIEYFDIKDTPLASKVEPEAPPVETPEHIAKRGPGRPPKNG